MMKMMEKKQDAQTINVMPIHFNQFNVFENENENIRFIRTNMNIK